MTRSTTTQSIIEHEGRHMRVLGPPASGKTALLVERFRWLESNGQRVAVITYGRAQRDRLVDALLGPDDARFGRAPVWTFPQLAGEIVSRSRPAMQGPLRELQEHVILDRVLSHPDHRLTSDLAAIARGGEFRRALLDVVHTLLQSGATAALAREVSATLSGRACDVLSVYAAYLDALAERNTSTFYDAAWQAVRALEDDAKFSPLGDYTALLVDDFGDVDAGQYALLRALAPPDGATEVDVFADSTGARFGYRGTRGRFALSDFPEDYSARRVSLSSPHADHSALSTVTRGLLSLSGCDEARSSRPDATPARTATPDTGEGQLSLFAKAAAPAAPNGVADQCRVFAADALEVQSAITTDTTAECQLVAVRVAELLAAGRFAASAIGIVAPDTHRYEQKLHAAMHDRGVALRGPRRGYYALDDYIDTILALLDGAWAHSEGRRTHAVAQLAASPCYPLLRASLEGILDLPPRRVEGDERDIERIMAWLGKQAMPGGKVAMSRLLEMTIHPVVACGDLDDAALAGVTELSEEWWRYVDAVGGTAERASLREFRHACRMTAPSRTAGAGAGVRLLSPREAASESFDAVFVMGLSEGVCPHVESLSHYLPFAEIATVLSPELAFGLEFHRARSFDERFRDEYALLLSALTRARDYLHVTAPQSFAGDDVTAPSNVVSALFDMSAPVARRHTGATLGAASAVAAVGRAAGAAVTDPRLMSVEARWLAPSPQPGEFAIDAFPMSPSQLDRFAKCPRLMFYGRVLGIEDEGSVYLTVGSLLHKVMEEVGRGLPSRAALLDGLDEARARELVEAACANSRDPIMPAETLQGLAIREHMVRLLEQFKGLERNRCGDYQIDAVEFDEPFERDGHRFTGKVDRVDRTENGRIVIDYKTGSSVHKTGKTILKYALNTRAESRYWQVPFYSYSLKQKDGEWPEAFYYYVFDPKDGPFVTGLIVAPEGQPVMVGDYYAGKRKGDIVSISPEQLDALMEEIVAITGRVFAPRHRVERTDRIGSKSPCRNCYFERLCERKQ